MCRVITFTVFTICLLYSSVSFSRDSNKAYDVRQFDIAGVKLGMTEAEAKKVLKEKLSLNDKDFRHGMKLTNRITKTKLPDYFQVNKNGINITFRLSVKLPLDGNNTMVVSQIRYKSNGTVEFKDIRKQAINKYGIPTKGIADAPDHLAHLRVAWCVPPSKTSGCELSKAYLTLNRGELFLFDRSFFEAERAYIKKSIKTKPVF